MEQGNSGEKNKFGGSCLRYYTHRKIIAVKMFVFWGPQIWDAATPGLFVPRQWRWQEYNYIGEGAGG